MSSIQKYPDIKKDLQSGGQSSIYFFWGNEPFLMDDLTKTAEEHVLKPGEEAFNKTVFYGNDCSAGQVLDQVRRFPMMAERQLVVLKEAHQMDRFQDLKPIFDKPVPSTVFVVVYKAEKIDKRQAIFKSVTKNATTFESKKLYESETKRWLDSYLTFKKLKLSSVAKDLILESLGTELENLANAVDKLVIAGKSGEVTDKVVEDVIGVNRSYTAFELQDAIGERNVAKWLKIAQVMEQNLKANPIQMVIPSLFSYLSKLFVIKQLGNNMPAVKKAIHINSDFIARKYVAAARKYSRIELEQMIHILRNYDLKSKGVGIKDIEMEDLMREMMLRLVYVNREN